MSSPVVLSVNSTTANAADRSSWPLLSSDPPGAASDSWVGSNARAAAEAFAGAPNSLSLSSTPTHRSLVHWSEAMSRRFTLSSTFAPGASRSVRMIGTASWARNCTTAVFPGTGAISSWYAPSTAVAVLTASSPANAPSALRSTPARTSAPYTGTPVG